jgi:hypothetical protein
LADGQHWTFPLPSREWLLTSWPGADEFSGLMRSMIEAEDFAERSLAELAFAIFLLGQNYRLSAVDYQELLDFGPESATSIDWRTALHELAEEHLVFFTTAISGSDTQKLSAVQGKIPRLLSWLRTNFSLHRKVSGSRSW